MPLPVGRFATPWGLEPRQLPAVARKAWDGWAWTAPPGAGVDRSWILPVGKPNNWNLARTPWQIEIGKSTKAKRNVSKTSWMIEMTTEWPQESSTIQLAQNLFVALGPSNSMPKGGRWCALGGEGKVSRSGRATEMGSRSALAISKSNMHQTNIVPWHSKYSKFNSNVCICLSLPQNVISWTNVAKSLCSCTSPWKEFKTLQWGIKTVSRRYCGESRRLDSVVFDATTAAVARCGEETKPEKLYAMPFFSVVAGLSKASQRHRENTKRASQASLA